MKTYQTFSSEETKAIGEKIAKAAKRVGEGALVFALKGELGAGKTTFTQGFFKGLGLKRRAPSPTFIIMRRHKVPRRRGGSKNGKNTAKSFSDVFHVDAYRLREAGHLAALGFKEILGNSENVVLIEWPERVRGIIPKNARKIRFKHGKRENERRIIIER